MLKIYVFCDIFANIYPKGVSEVILVHFLEIWCRNGCRMGLRFWHFCDFFKYFFLVMFSRFGGMLGVGLPPSGGTPLQSTNNRVFEACKPRCLRRGLRRSGLLQPRRFLQEPAAGFLRLRPCRRPPLSCWLQAAGCLLQAGGCEAAG